MEMSRRLVASDEKIGFLGIIDTYFNVRGADRDCRCDGSGPESQCSPSQWCVSLPAR
jgi:thioesterase domain-containing protein